MEATVELEVSGARYLAIIGARPEERSRRQPVELSLRMTIDPGKSLTSDSLSDTISYSTLLKEAAAVLQDGEFQLLEAAAHAIAVRLLNHAELRSVVVRVDKLRPPVEADVRSVAATVTLVR